ncbi:MAG: hypothetical protein QOG82_1716 [Actinomycetota bacterium]|jgi:hypothetical protein|nr:hypothetical protein [Actinomycetota bacterium]
MTDLETYRPPTIPAGRPVHRFVAAWLALALLFGALWWSGLVAPRLSLGNTAGGSYNTETGRATVDVTLHNNSPFAVEVRHANPAKGRVRVDSVRINGVDVATRGQKVAGGGEAKMLIELNCGPYAIDDRIPRQSPPSGSVKLEVTVRTAIGLERTGTTGTINLPRTCFG